MRERVFSLIRRPAGAARPVLASGYRALSTYGLLWIALACGTGFLWYMTHPSLPEAELAGVKSSAAAADPALSEHDETEIKSDMPAATPAPDTDPASDSFDFAQILAAVPTATPDSVTELNVEFTPDLPSSGESLWPDDVPVHAEDLMPQQLEEDHAHSESNSFLGSMDLHSAPDDFAADDFLEIEPIDVQPFDETVTGFQAAADARSPLGPADSGTDSGDLRTKPAPVPTKPALTRDELIDAFGQTTLKPIGADPTTTESADPATASPKSQSQSKSDSPIMNLDHNAAARDPFWWEAALQKTLLDTGPPQALDLTSALAFAIRLAPELHVLRADHAIAEQLVRQREAGFDWNTFLQSSWNQDSNPVGSILDGTPNRLREKNWTLRGGVRRGNQHGGQLELAQEFGYRNSNSSFIRPTNNQGSGRLSFDYTHPLMRQRGILYNTSPIALAEIAREIAHDHLMAGIENHLLDVASTYWELVFTRGQLVQNQRAHEQARALLDEMSNRQNADVRPNQLARAEASLLGYQSRVVESRHDAKRSQESLLRLIYGSSYTEHAVEIIPTTSVRDEVALSDPARHVDDGLRNRSEIQAVLREIRAATLEQDLAANEILPTLNLVMSGYSAGLEGNSDVTGAWVNQFASSEPGFAVGIEFEVPYRNRAAHAAADGRRIAVERFRKRFEAVVADITLDVRSQLVNVARDTQLSEVRTQALDRTGQELEFLETQHKLPMDGTRVSDLYFDNLVQTRNRYLSAEFSVLRTRIQLALSQMELLRGKGMMHTLVAAEVVDVNSAKADSHSDQNSTPAIETDEDVQAPSRPQPGKAYE